MSDAPALLDVNVPMYAAGRDHPYREACVEVLSKVADGELVAVIDTEIIQEILYRYGAMREWDVAVKMATNLLQLVPEILPVLPSDAATSVELFARYAPEGVMARDLIHVAVMRNNGINTIISTDAHFDLIEGIKRLDPVNLQQESDTT